MFGRATIRLGIGPHSSYDFFAVFDPSPLTVCINCSFYGRPMYFCPVISIFFFLLSSFLPRLISAVGDWMSIILPHMALVRI